MEKGRCGMLTDCLTCQHYNRCEQSERWDVGCINYKMMPIRNPTNADRIRSMTDEELATWMNCMQSNAYHCGEFGRTNAAYPFDNKAWNDWLKSPVKDGE